MDAPDHQLFLILIIKKYKKENNYQSILFYQKGRFLLILPISEKIKNKLQKKREKN